MKANDDGTVPEVPLDSGRLGRTGKPSKRRNEPPAVLRGSRNVRTRATSTLVVASGLQGRKDQAMLAASEVRQNTINHEPDPERRRWLQFFHELDLETLSPFVELRLEEPLLTQRKQAVDSLTKALRNRALLRATHSHCQQPGEFADADPAWAGEVKHISELMVRLLKAHFGDPVGVVDVVQLRRAFDEFARGKLFVGPGVADGAPDSANFVCFAVFAEVASQLADPPEADLWLQWLHVFVAAVDQFLIAFRPPAPAFSLYEPGQPRPIPAISDAAWEVWAGKSRDALLDELDRIMARAFRKSLTCTPPEA